MLIEHPFKSCLYILINLRKQKCSQAPLRFKIILSNTNTDSLFDHSSPTEGRLDLNRVVELLKKRASHIGRHIHIRSFTFTISIEKKTLYVFNND